MHDNDHPRTTLLLLLAPMLAVVVVNRLYLHLVNPEVDLFVAGYNVHHLFTGALIEIPAAFALAFGIRARLVRWAALAALGGGSGMILDEVVYLITTDGSNASYLTPISLWGAVVLVGLGVVLLVILYACGQQPRGPANGPRPRELPAAGGSERHGNCHPFSIFSTHAGEDVMTHTTRLGARLAAAVVGGVVGVCTGPFVALAVVGTLFGREDTSPVSSAVTNALGLALGGIGGGLLGAFLVGRPSVARWCLGMAFGVGAVSFLAGFIGPILLKPDSPQGPLLGIFITGPAGFVVGAVIGFSVGLMKERARYGRGPA